MATFLQLATISAANAEQPSVHTTVILVLILLIAGLALALAAPRLKLPYPILLVLGGLLLGFVPGLPRFTLDPDLIFLLFLPPLIYASAWFTSWRDFKRNLRPISLLAIGLVFFTTIFVAIVAHAIIPGLPWAVAFVLGAIVSPTDAVAATSIMERLSIPRRIVTVLEGESLVNDASGIVAYQFAVVAVTTGAFSLADAGVQFVVESVGGIAIGLAIGWCLTQIHRRLNNPTLEIIMTLLTPFAAYLLADTLHTSGVLATVAAGLYLTRKSSVLFSAQTRQQALAVWNILVFLLNGLTFIFIGLQLRNILEQLNDTIANHTVLNLVWYALGICIATMVVRMLWVIPATYLPRLLSRRVRERDPIPNWRNVVIIGWTGMRGVVSLAVALAIPEVTERGAPFPERPLVLYLTFCVILFTLVVQGLSLPLLIRILGLTEDDEAKSEEVKARQTAIQTALSRIDELIEQELAPVEIAGHIREHYAVRAQNIQDFADGKEDEQGKSQFQTYRTVEQEVLRAMHDSVVRLRDEGEINDEVLRRIERDLDLEEEQLEEQDGR